MNGNHQTIEVEATDIPDNQQTDFKPVETSLQPAIHVNFHQTSHNSSHATSLAQVLTEPADDTSLIKVVAKELLLNLIIPERLLMTCKALLFIATAWLLMFDVGNNGGLLDALRQALQSF